MADDDLTPHGAILERARGGLSKREAARRSGISEGRWRQIVTGRQSAGGGNYIPVNPKRETLINMAAGVGADVGQVLVAAGMEPLVETELRDGDVGLANESEDMEAIRAAIAAMPESDRARPTLDDIRDRLDAVMLEAARARRMLDRLGDTNS